MDVEKNLPQRLVMQATVPTGKESFEACVVWPPAELWSSFQVLYVGQTVPCLSLGGSSSAVLFDSSRPCCQVGS